MTEVGLLLLALAIVAALLVGANLPFFGNFTNNIMTLVKSLGDGGLVGLITIGIIIWLFSGRSGTSHRRDAMSAVDPHVWSGRAWAAPKAKPNRPMAGRMGGGPIFGVTPPRAEILDHCGVEAAGPARWPRAFLKGDNQ